MAKNSDHRPIIKLRIKSSAGRTDSARVKNGGGGMIFAGQEDCPPRLIGNEVISRTGGKSDVLGKSDQERNPKITKVYHV